jgi:hypothetical protein
MAHTRSFSAALVAGLVLTAGCKDNPVVEPVDLPTTDAISGALTRTGIQTLALGVLAQDRALVRGDLSYLVISNIYSRDLFRIDPNEPRYVSETLAGTPDPGGFSGSGGWTNGYVAIRAANQLLAGLPGALDVATNPGGITAGQKNATAGFIQTIKALEYYRLLELRDSLGVVIQPMAEDSLGPVVCKSTALNYIAALLDSANTSLTAAGSASLPFTPPSGFTAFGRNYATAANLVLLNRGLKGKVDVYRGLNRPTPTAGAFTAAIAELTQALGGAAPGTVDPTTFQNGAYLTFVASGTEGAANPMSDARIGVNPRAQAALQAGDRRSSKIIPRAAISGGGIATSLTYVGASTANTANLTRPIAILRNEEIVLLRAQAYIEAGQLASATADLNSVRTSYGLAAYPVFTTAAAARQALLYEKRFSLFAEGPQRLVDLRAYGLLNAASTPAEVTGDPFNTAIPIPKAEADARGGRQNVTPVCS